MVWFQCIAQLYTYLHNADREEVWLWVEENEDRTNELSTLRLVQKRAQLNKTHSIKITQLVHRDQLNAFPSPHSATFS